MKIKLTIFHFFFRRKLLITIMRSFIILFSTIVFGISSNSLISQNSKVVIDKGKNFTVEEVFKIIKQQTDYRFIYQIDMFKNYPEVFVEKGTIRTNKLLGKVFGTGDFRISLEDGKTIVINEKKALQQLKISGEIIAEDSGVPLPGVTIVVKGSNKGTTSDFDGNYSLSVYENSVLIFSYIGYKTQEVPVNGKSVLNVKMEVDTSELDEVIVTALGLSRSTKSLGYAATNIKSEELTETTENSVIDALSGKIAGLDISSSSGGVGSSSRIILRGIKNLQSSSEPLFVVDGVPVNNSLRSEGRVDLGNSIADFNSDDIAEITVLKSAAASALYGSAGSNGVIVIKTKNGANNNNLGLEISTSITTSTPFRLIDYQNEYGPGLAGADWDYTNRRGGSDGWGNAFGVQPLAIQWNSPLDANGDLVPLPLRAYPNNGKEFFDLGLTRDNSIAISKGEADKYNFRLALRNIHEDGIVPTTELTRNTMTFNGGAHITKKLKANVNLIYTDQESPNRVTSQNWSDNPIRQALILPRHINVDALRNYEDLLANGVPLPSNNSNVVVPGWQANNGDFYPNPFYTLNNVNNEHQSDRMLATVNLEYDFTKWLSLDVRVSKEIINEKREIKRNAGVRLWNGSEYSYNGSYFRDQFVREGDFANALLKAKNKIGDFGLNSLLGIETRRNVLDGSSFWAREIQLPNLFTSDNVVGEPVINQYYSEIKKNSVFGSLDIDYKSLIYLTLTARNDWDSTLPENNRSYFYPSASLSILLSSIVDLPSVFSFVKLRGNVGRVGSGTRAYQIFPTLDTNNNLTGLFEATLRNAISNPTLKPTRTTTYEVGADIRLFDNRLNFDIAAYVGNSIDQIQNVNLPNSTGYTSRIINAGDIENKGIEIGVNAIPIDNDFKWELGFTYSKNENKVLSLAEGVDEILIASRYSNIRSVARPGEPYGQLMGFGYQRDPQGNIIHNNGYAIQTDEQVVLGNVMPDWIGSFTNTLRYKGFSLSAQVNARIGGDVFSLTNQWASSSGLTQRTLGPNRDGFIVGNGVIEQNDGTFVPNNVSVSYRNYVRDLNRWGFHEPSVFDGSFVKLKAVQFYYTFSKKSLTKTPFSSLKMGVVGRNLALLYSKAPNIDPESTASASNQSQGFEEFNLPTARTFTFNVTMKF